MSLAIRLGGVMPDVFMLAFSFISDDMAFYALPLIGSTMLAYAIFNLVTDLRRKESKKIAERLRDRDGLANIDTPGRVKDSLLRQTRGPSTSFGAAIAKLKFTSGLQKILEQANIQWSATAVLVNLVGLASTGVIVTYFLVWPWWASALVGAGLFGLPLSALVFKRNLRINKFLHQLPDVFELMAQGLRAGHSLPNAILLISQQMPDPVGGEFAQVFHEQNLGIKLEDALKGMGKRIGLLDVRFFVTAVLIQRQTGGDLAEVLDNISGVIRGRIKLFGTVKALTAEGRLSGWVLLALPMVVFMLELVINPSYANLLLEEPIGQYMLIGAGISQVLGLLMIKKIVNIKV